MQLLLALISFGLFVVEASSGVLLMPPVSKVRPIVTKYTGRFTYLTFQTNCIGCLYFALNLLHELNLFNGIFFLAKLFPLVFGMSAFMTVAYYGLEHFNPETRARREDFERQGWYVACYLFLPVSS